MATTERYIVDAQGNRVAVVIDMDDYKHLLEELEELRERDEMRRYDAARDPDAGLKVRDDVRAELLQAQADYEAGRLTGKPLDYGSQAFRRSHLAVKPG